MSTSPPDPRQLVRGLRRSPVVRSLAEATRTRRSVRAIRRSRLFDEAWYRAQLSPEESVDDAIVHYVTEGADRGLQPHPLVDPAFIRSVDASARRSGADPLTHLLGGAGRRLVDPHPLFDARLMASRHPAARRHPAGPLGWYLADPGRHTAPPTELLRPAQAPTAADFLGFVREVHRRGAAVPDHRSFPRTVREFDHDAAAAFVADARAAAHLGPPTLVSVVMPTRDRADVLPAAVASVLGQSWPHLELLIVDDGSTDATRQVVDAIDDERVTYLYQPPSGVSRARNLGLEHARGTYVAYLDSDNTWDPVALETMVSSLTAHGHRAGYSAAEIRTVDGVEYRGQPLDRAALAERNYIDLNCLVHERSLIGEVGGFDEGLRRVVDWDLVLRLAAVTELAYVPFVGTYYDGRDDRVDRITVAESIGYRFEVRSRTLVDWASAPTPVTGRTSVVLVCRDTDDHPAEAAATALAAHRLAGSDVELLVVDNGSAAPDATRLRLLEVAHSDVQVHRVADRVNVATCVNLAAAKASGDVLVIADPQLEIDAPALQTCADEVRSSDAAAVQPRYVSLDGTIASTGWLSATDGTPISVGFGLAADDRLVTAGRTRDAVEAYGFAVDAEAFRAVGGFQPVFVTGYADVDLGRRLRDAGGRSAVSATAEALLPAWPAVKRYTPSFDDARELRRRGGTGRHGTYEELVDDVATVDVVTFEPAPRFSYHGAQRWNAAHVARSGAPRRWAIKTATPDVVDRQAWGDWYFAHALRDALERLGEHAVVDLRRGWYRPSSRLDDIDLVLRGTQRYESPPGRTSLLWVISHPDSVTEDEVAGHAGVFVASEAFVDEASRRWRCPVQPLLQATDPDRFTVAGDPSLTSDVLFVGNTRGVRRRIVADAIEAGLDVTIYGAGWEGLVPDDLISGTYVPNDRLGRYYASAEVVLADHWEDMRAKGFFANRLFDAVAAGAAVVCDDVAGVEAHFGGAVRTYRTADDLAAAVAAAKAWRAERSDREGASAVAGDTFDDRAATLVAWADANVAVPG